MNPNSELDPQSETPEQLQKHWWQSKTIIGIVAMLLSQIIKLFHVDLLPQEIVDIITFSLDSGGAALAIYGRIKARHALTMSIPGGPFNPNAPVRRALPVNSRDNKGHTLLAALCLIVAFYLSYFTTWACATWQVNRYDERWHPYNSSLIYFHKVEDQRSFIVRFISSLHIFPAIVVVHGPELKTSYGAKVEFRGGAEF